MKFYSYKYLLSKVEQNNMIEYILGGILIVVLVLSLYKYYKNKEDSKYRELAIIMIFGIFLLVGIEVSSYQKSSISADQYKGSVRFIENIASHLNVEKDHIYINNEASIENSFIKIENSYYRVISSGKKDDYLLEKIELIDPVVELVEVEK